MSLDQNLLFAFSLAQGGEFAFVLLSFATRYGVVDESLAATADRGDRALHGGDAAADDCSTRS